MKRWSKALLTVVVSIFMIANASVVAFASEGIEIKTDPDGAGTISQIAPGGAITVVTSVAPDASVSLIETPNNENEFDRWDIYVNNETTRSAHEGSSVLDLPEWQQTFNGNITKIVAVYNVPSNPGGEGSTSEQSEPPSSSGTDESLSNSEPEPAPTNPEPQQEEPSEPPAPPVTIVSTAAGSALPTAGLGTAAVTTKSVSLNLYQMTPAQYVNFVVATVEATPAGGETIIDLNTASCLNAKMAQIISGRSDVTVNIIYIENGVRKLIRIPAGSDVSALLDANGFIGFTALANVFGATEIVH